MFSSPAMGKSVDNLSPLSPNSRSEFPFHSRQGQAHGRPISRRGSTASSIHSIGGTLDTSTGGWGSAVYESGQNAISTLLQPPIVRTGLQPHTSAHPASTHKPPTARDIPPVTLTNVRKVENEEFSSYLSQVGALYEQLRRVRETEDDAPRPRRDSRNDDHAEDASDNHLRPGFKTRTRKGSTTSLSSLNSLDAPSPVRRSSSNFGRKGAQGPPPLSTIPTVYFDDNFQLENPRTFDVVSERSEVIRPTNTGTQNENGAAAAPRKALATNAILQEKLSWYMDTIEVHLINSISSASTTFFTALGSLKELHSEAADSVRRIKVLRQELETLDKEVAERGLETAQKQRRQENLYQLNEAVLQLRQIIEGVAHCETLVDGGDVEKALSSIDSLERLIAGERDDTTEDDKKPRLRDLRSASALRGVNTDLSTLRFRIGKAYESQFCNALVSDLHQHADNVSVQDVLLRWSNAASRSRGGHARSPSVFPSYLARSDELRVQLMPVMRGLYRAKHIATAALTFREAALRDIRNIIRKPLPSSNDDDNESMMSVSTAGGNKRSNQEKSSILARNLRALDAEDAEEMLRTIYIGVTETLRRLSTQVKVLLDIASSLSDESNDGLKSPPPRSPMTSPRPDRHARGPSLAGPHFEIQEELHKTLDVNNLLGQAVDVANEKIVKVLKVRAEQASQLPLDLFLRYFTLNLYFANECEAISGRSGTSLKTVVNGHIKEFVQKNRDAEMQKLAQGMESDQWNAKDFTDENAEVLKQLVDSSTQDSALWAEKTSIWIPYSDFSNAAQDTPAPETNGTGKDKTRTASIEDEKFNLPNSAILCLNGMANFVQLMAGIPSMTTDIASSLLSYLQLFNSRCTQLILGAGATKSAGLKNITTKHLALASQALSFIYTLVPHIREFVRRHAGSGAGVSGLMGEFDKVKRQLQEHQDNIHQKLVEIMSGRASAHSKSMAAIDWDSESSPAPHQYMETLAKETTTLHRVLTKNLPESSIQMIMFPVFSSYKEQLGKALNEANPRTEAGKQSMLADLDLFSTKLGKLDGFSDAGDYLKGIVQAKEVKTPKPSTSTQETKAEDDTVAEAESKTSAGTEEAPTNESDKAEGKKSDDS
ncbi:Vps54-domain-containing protein [Sarocladium strictum]